MSQYYLKQKVYAKGKTFIYKAVFPDYKLSGIKPSPFGPHGSVSSRGWEVEFQGGTLNSGDEFFYISCIYRKLKNDKNSDWVEVSSEIVRPRMRKILGNKLVRNNNRLIKKQKHRQKKIQKIIQ